LILKRRECSEEKVQDQVLGYRINLTVRLILLKEEIKAIELLASI